MSDDYQYFHFTIGPVQGFVAQARRTRDFWGGSFLLSWLAGNAMVAVQAQAGKDAILFPVADESYLDWVRGDGKGVWPSQGSIPNRFKAKVPKSFNPDDIVNAVNTAWRNLAERIWKSDLKKIAPGNKGVWDRQVESFWEITWGLTDDIEDSAILDRLKNWRSHFPPPEPGVKCMVMDGLQELSGAARPGGEVREFWDQVRNQQNVTGIQSDLREGEHLCAIAFIKRRFVRHFDKVPGGWKLNPGVPSVVYMAAAPWLARMLKAFGHEAEAEEFYTAAYKLLGQREEWNTEIKCVVEACKDKERTGLDGAIYYDALLENADNWNGKGEQGREVLGKLKAWRNKAKAEPVSPFYAVLLMDGDSLGSHMSERSNQPKISQALDTFTRQVPITVKAHNGFLIYAGGDDVLAVLPLEDALPCASALRQDYLKAFSGTGIPTTLSGAIEYAHIKMPLGKVLADAHPLLDQIAKDGAGRDAIACRVWKPGGLHLEWVQPWETALDDDGKTLVLHRLAEDFRNQDKEDGEFASKFFYRIRELFVILNGEAKTGSPLLGEEQQTNLMTMEYLNSGSAGEKPVRKEVKEKVSELLGQCRAHKRNAKDPQNVCCEPRDGRLGEDAALLLRFLATKGVE